MEQNPSAKPSAPGPAEPAITPPIQLELFGLTKLAQPWGPLPTIIEPTVTGGNLIDDRLRDKPRRSGRGRIARTAKSSLSNIVAIAINKPGNDPKSTSTNYARTAGSSGRCAGKKRSG